MDIKALENKIEKLELDICKLEFKNSQLNSSKCKKEIIGSAGPELKYSFFDLSNFISAYLAFLNVDTLRYDFVNVYYMELYGLEKEKLIGKHVKDIIGEKNYLNDQGKSEKIITNKY